MLKHSPSTHAFPHVGGRLPVSMDKMLCSKYVSVNEIGDIDKVIHIIFA